MKWGIATIAATCLLAGSTVASADVQVTMHDGRVSVVAKDATLRQIMTEWARVGQTKVVNVERIPGGPLTLELRDLPEDQALDVLMRPLSGYLAAPRPAPMPNLSRFDRILVMPTMAAVKQATAVASGPAAPVYPTPTPVFAPPPPNAPPPSDENDGVPVENSGAARAPVFTAFPAPQVVNPNAGPQGAYVPPPGMTMPGAATTPAQVATPGSVPSAPVGVAVPGMMPPSPPLTTVPATPQTRRPGGGL